LKLVRAIAINPSVKTVTKGLVMVKKAAILVTLGLAVVVMMKEDGLLAIVLQSNKSHVVIV
jgi:hypothetical protein